MEEVTFFLHIEKTGGISIRNILESNYPADEHLKFYDSIPGKIAAFKRLSPGEQEKIKWVCGHFDFGIHRQMGIRQYRYVTLLRNPMERMISFYYYFIKNPSEFTTYGRDHNIGFETYIRGAKHTQVDNGQTRRIAGASHLEVGTCGNAHLEQAKENLGNHFSVVGILESFHETLLLLREHCQLKNIFYLEANKTAQRPQKNDLPASITRIIEKYNQLDLELYHYAKKRLEKRVKEKGAGFKKEVEAFKALYHKNETVFEDFDRGLKDFREGRLGVSEQWFRRVIDFAAGLPGDHEIIIKSWFYLAEISRSRDAEEARGYYEKSLGILSEKNPKTEEETYMMGSILKRLKRYEEALACFRGLTAVSGLKRFVSGACFHMAEIYLEIGKKSEAVEMMRKTLELNPLHRKAGEYLEEWKES